MVPSSLFSAHMVLNQWKHAQSLEFESLLVPLGASQSGGERWTKPAANRIKINVDGAIF